MQKFEAVYTPAGKTAKTENRFLIQNIRTFGLTESEIVMDLHNGVKEIVDIEKRFNPEKEAGTTTTTTTTTTAATKETMETKMSRFVVPKILKIKT